MATSELYSHSPRVPGAASLKHQAPVPMTPVHSPHHSVHSSTSLRTPLHTLSIHEYRKQQSTPLSRIATPSGKTLRRKASAFALNEIERVPSTRPGLHIGSHSTPRSLQPSHSAHQLASQNPSFGIRIGSDQVYRSQSAEPEALHASISSVATIDSRDRVRHFSTRKRLPRPLATKSSGLHPVDYAPVRPTRQIRATLPAPLSFLAEGSSLSETKITSTPSLSRFPQPPHFETLRETEREKAVSFAPIAPATPPATPATIHYRGASFDLVNPHASLPYHDIVTPSRDRDSSELPPPRSSQESQSSLFEMAPRRPLYGDLNAAHAGIVRRAEDAYSSSILDLPLPPMPAAVTPGSSTYTSPVYSPESRFAPSPLAVRKASDGSRFSIKQLARTLTKRLTKPTELGEEEELRQLQEGNFHGLSVSTDAELLRPLEQTYIPKERSSYFLVSPVSPISPTSPASFNDLDSPSSDNEDAEDDNKEIGLARRESRNNQGSNGLASMLPDDPSTQVGRAGEYHGYSLSLNHGTRPYYDDLASIYASSSIYTGDDYRRSTYQQSLGENSQSTAFLRYSGMSAADMANEYSNRDLGKTSRPFSRPLAQELYHRSLAQDDDKTDTISKLIDQYDPEYSPTSLASQNVNNTSDTSILEPYTSFHEKRSATAVAPAPPSMTGFGQFQFDLEPAEHSEGKTDLNVHVQPTDTTRRTLRSQPGVAPTVPPPLAPAFQYERANRPLLQADSSDMFSVESNVSYGDTRNLLQLPQAGASGLHTLVQALQPSSSYSQPVSEAPDVSSSYSQPEDRTSPQTPQDALDQAELIFDRAAVGLEPSSNDIPAIWGRRSPVNVPRNKRLTGGSALTMDNENPDWETVAGDSQHGRISLDSIADYSSSEGSRGSLGPQAAGSLPSWSKQDHARGSSFYSHPSPIRGHAHPFRSSPPRLATRPGSQIALDISASGFSSGAPTSSTMPAFRFSDQHRNAVDEPYAFAPWADPYALSDKETQELLASGPNDNILFDADLENRSNRLSYKFKSHARPLGSSSLRNADEESRLERENTFEKITFVGPKGNLTGSPRGTGMHDAGSSIADTSSPGAKLSSNFGFHSPRSDHDGFYASPFPATGSVTRIGQSSSATAHDHERTPSQITLFPSSYSLEPVQGSSPLASPDCRRSLRCSTTLRPASRASRAAVPGQTKLRQMVLAPDTRSTISSKDTRFSHFLSIGASGRPSTSDTATPLHPSRPSLDTFPTIGSVHTFLSHQHSPHLLCPERKPTEEDEIRRRKLSWLIFACFCALPPCMFLYRTWGDAIIVSVTKGDLGHCTAKSKRVALIAGVIVNIGLITAILVPILIAQALKAI